MTKKIVTIIGPSGSGKSTLLDRTFTKDQLLRSVVTRKPRKNEIPNQDYIFVDTITFQKLIKNNQLLQYVTYNNNFYGMLKSEIENKLKIYDTVAIPIVYSTLKDFQNFAKQLANTIVVPVFTNISKATLLTHFESRTESLIEKQKRIKKYDQEILNIKHFDNEHILDMNPDDHALSASNKLELLLKSL